MSAALSISTLVLNEQARREAFPVCKRKIFFGHAGVTVLPRAVAGAMIRCAEQSCVDHQEFGEVLNDVNLTRRIAAQLIAAQPEEIALLGPTSLGLSLFANGIPWNEGDEILCYAGDYPANVYPWMDLQRKGVILRYLEPARIGELTPELVAAALTPRTRMVALASCNFFSGYRIDVDAIGRLLHERGVLFSLDAIQTLGAFPLSVQYVDFLSADAHKWMLGPMAIGIVYVNNKHFDLLRPTLLGAWNVVSPNFITQDAIAFHPTARRYEPGVLNIAGIYGMKAAMELALAIGLDNIAARLLELKKRLIDQLTPLGFEIIPPLEGPNASGITTLRHPVAGMTALFHLLEKNNIVASLRHDRTGVEYIRFSPHFYNTIEEVDRVVEVLRQGLGGIPV
jgi:selenocysteine lyase/cysteine desulfurase